MPNYLDRARNPVTGYLWRAFRSEPGQHGSAWRITVDNKAPESIAPSYAAPGLIYDSSLFGDWHLLGEIDHPLERYSELGQSFVGVIVDGELLSAEEIATRHRYRTRRGA